MDSFQSSETVFYGNKEYTETILNNDADNSSVQEEHSRKDPNAVYVSSLDDDDKEEETWPLTCEEKEILKTIPCASLHEIYVSKKVITSGTKGLRPHYRSFCTFVVESAVLLDSEFSGIIERSVFADDRKNLELNLEIGSSDSELERALELALLDMCEGERSEVMLNASKRKKKVRDQYVLPVPCLKCIINLKRVTGHCGSSVKPGNMLFLLDANKEEKYLSALNEKARGIELFKREKYVEAFHRFSVGVKMIMILDCFLLESCTEDPQGRKVNDTGTKNDQNENDKNILSLYSTLCSNMAECQLRENNPTQAIALCRRALTHDPCNVKALFRQASGAWALGDVDQADSLLRKLFELDPHNSAAKQLHGEVQVKIQKYEDEYIKMMKRIFSK